MATEIGIPQLSNVLSKEERDKIPEIIRSKIETFIKSNVEEYVTAKVINERKEKTLSEELIVTKRERDSLQNQLNLIRDEFQDVNEKYAGAEGDLARLNEKIRRLEEDCDRFRQERNLAVDGKEEAIQTIVRQNTQLKRLQEDLSEMKTQLDVANKAKCEAIAKADEMEGLKIELDYKEKRLDKDRILFLEQIQGLSADVSNHNSDLINLRREHTANVILLQSQLSENIEELNKARSAHVQLTETNQTLSERIEILTQKLSAHRENEAKLNENYQQEITAQTKIADLYKNLSEESASKSAELMMEVKQLEKMLKDASQQFREYETNKSQEMEKIKETIGKKDECIENLKKELQHANSPVEVAKKESMETVVESLSPAAVAASQWLKSGTTLAQIYCQCATASEKLLLEKENSRKLNLYINTILKELDEKAPLLKKQKQDYDNAMVTVEEMTVRINEMEGGIVKLKHESNEAEKLANHLTCENKRLSGNVADLSRQVCFLLKKVEELRGHEVSTKPASECLRADMNTSADVISKNLITFSDIQELQTTNQQLLAFIRELTSKLERDETDKESSKVEELQKKVKSLKELYSEMLENEKVTRKALEVVKRQRDTYKMLFQQHVKGETPPVSMDIEEKGLNCGKGSLLESTPFPKTSEQCKTSIQVEQDKEKLKLKEQLNGVQKELSNLQREFDNYRKERAINEKMLNEELERYRNNVQDKIKQISGLVAKSESMEQNVKTLQANANMYKVQVTSLENKINNYTNIVAKQEQSIMHLRDEALSANSKLSRAEVLLENMKQEYRLLKESEARLMKERDVLMRERQGQKMFLANIGTINASKERSEAEEKVRLEACLHDAMNECSATRQMLQDEQDKFRDRVDLLEKQTALAKQRKEEEEQLRIAIRTELEKAKEELQKKQAQIDSMNIKMREIKHTMVPDPSTEERARNLEQQLLQRDCEITSLKGQLDLAKKNVQGVIKETKHQVTEITEAFDKYKEETTTRFQNFEDCETGMRNTIERLEGEVKSLTTNYTEAVLKQKELVQNVDAGLKLKDELISSKLELTKTNKLLDKAREQLKSVQEEYHFLKEKYSDDMKTLAKNNEDAVSRLKESLNVQNEELANTKKLLDKSNGQLKSVQEDYSATKEKFSEEVKTLTINNKNTVSNLTESLILQKEELLNITSELVKTKELLGEIKDQLKLVQEENSSIKEKYDKVKNLTANGEEIVKDLRESMAIQEEQLTGTKSELTKTKELLAMTQEQLAFVQEEYNSEKEKHAKEVTTLTSDNEKTVSDLRDSMSIQKDELTSTRAELAKTNELLDNISEQLKLVQEYYNSTKAKYSEEVKLLTASKEEAFLQLRESMIVLKDELTSTKSESENTKQLLTEETEKLKSVLEEFIKAKQSYLEEVNILTISNDSAVLNLSESLDKQENQLMSTISELAELKELLVKAKDQMKSVQDEHKSSKQKYSDELKTLTTENNKTILNLRQSMDVERDELTSTKSELEKTIECLAKSEEQLKSIQEQHNTTKHKYSEEVEMLKMENEKTVSDLRESMTVQKNELINTRSELEQIKELFSNAKNQLKSLQELYIFSKKQYSNEIKTLTTENDKTVSNLRQCMDVQKDDLMSTKSELEKTRECLAKAEEQLKSIQEQHSTTKHNYSEEVKMLKTENEKTISNIRESMMIHKNELISTRTELEEIKELFSNSRDQLKSLQEEYNSSKQKYSNEIMTLTMEKDKTVSNLSQSMDIQKGELMSTKSELEKTRECLAKAEEQLKSIQEQYSFAKQKYSEELKMFKTNNEKTVSNMNESMSSQKDEMGSVLIEKKEILGKTRDEMKSFQEEYTKEKCSATVTQNTTPNQELITLKKDLDILRENYRKLEEDKNMASKDLNLGRADWESQEASFKNEIKVMQESITDLNMQNGVLRDQLETVTQKLTKSEVNATNAEADNLRKEIDSIKTSSKTKEERAKAVLKTARSHIIKLSKENNTLKDELLKIRNKLNDYDKIKIKGESLRQFVEKRKEHESLRERLLREVNVNQQREKQQVPQSASLTPWRGSLKTPFVSIRPRLMESRITVQPTIELSGRKGITSSLSSPVQSTSYAATARQATVPSTQSLQVLASSSRFVAVRHQPQLAEQSVVVSSQQGMSDQSLASKQQKQSVASCSYTVTTTQTAPGLKRLRGSSAPIEGDTFSKPSTSIKRKRYGGESSEMPFRSNCPEIEYQVPTSSQRDQEEIDDLILLGTSSEDDDYKEEEVEDEEEEEEDNGDSEEVWMTL